MLTFWRLLGYTTYVTTLLQFDRHMEAYCPKQRSGSFFVCIYANNSSLYCTQSPIFNESNTVNIIFEAFVTKSFAS